MVVSINKFELSTELVTVTDQKADFSRVSSFKKEKDQGPVSRKSRKLFGSEKPFVKLRPAYSVKLVFHML